MARPPSRAAPSVPPATSSSSSSSPPPVKRSEARKSPPATIPVPSPSRPETSETRATPAVSGTDVTRVPTLPRSPPALTRLLSGYTLQAGVFTDPRRAEEVYAKLAQEGIPVTLETRVLVGPFKNRKEADSARAKMKAMGIDALPVARSEKR
ncbi:MAG: SPOR domain-containing protein [Azoarcus sp.]|nr:SPOR domain-containing protein [Azoarcus sp.]